MLKTFRAGGLALLTFTLIVALLATSLLVNTPAYATEAGLNWTGQYWNNADLSGNPTVTRVDTIINFNWGNGSPDASIPADNFSARWTYTANFNGGNYTFRIGADDGMRLFVDNISVLDRWSGFGTGFGTATTVVNLAAGQHTLRVEFVERGGQAGALFDWEPPIGGGISLTSTPGGLITATPFGTVTAVKTTPTVPTVEVIVSGANIRPDPSTNNPPIRQASLGQRFTLTGYTADGAWWQVDLGNGQRGWFARRVVYIFPNSAERVPVLAGVATSVPGPIEPASGTARTNVVMRAAPSLRAAKVGVVNAGENFQIIALGKSNRAWVKIQLSNGQTGWVFTPYIVITNGNLNRLPITD
jgi:uncharacterized protein YraI